MSRIYTHKINSNRKQIGFSLVELLIVIVIIGIISAIGTTVFAQMNTRAYDASVQQDLSNIAKKLKLYQAEYGVYPITAQLPSLGLKANKSAYGSHYDNGETTYNFLYCRIPAAAPTQFALVAYSRSGKGYQYSSGGQLSEYKGPKTGTGPMCTAAGVSTAGAVADRDWFYYYGAWQSYISG